MTVEPQEKVEHLMNQKMGLTMQAALDLSVTALRRELRDAGIVVHACTGRIALLDTLLGYIVSKMTDREQWREMGAMRHELECQTEGGDWQVTVDGDVTLRHGVEGDARRWAALVGGKAEVMTDETRKADWRPRRSTQ
jgi:hypothetical protein